MTTLSVLIITKNEEQNIKACLESVSFADEVIVYDAASTDKTVEIAKNYTNKVTVTNDWPGEGIQRTRALNEATSKWILFLDADERVSPELADELQNVIKNDEFEAYNIPFQSHFLGKAIRFGSWTCEKHVRLFKKDFAAFTNVTIHSTLAVDGKTGTLKKKIIHFPYPNIEKVLKKMNLYTSTSATLKVNKGKSGSLTKALINSLWTFLHGYILRLGFLDGKEGFILAVSNAQGTYYKYLKMCYLTNK